MKEACKFCGHTNNIINKYGSYHFCLKCMKKYYQFISERSKTIVDYYLKVQSIKKTVKYFNVTRGRISQLFIQIFILINRHEKYANVPFSEMDIYSIYWGNTTIRTQNCLCGNSIYTINDLCSYSEKELIKFRNFGKRCLEDIKKTLAKNDLSLRQDETEIKKINK